MEEYLYCVTCRREIYSWKKSKDAPRAHMRDIFESQHLEEHIPHVVVNHVRGNCDYCGAVIVDNTAPTHVIDRAIEESMKYLENLKQHPYNDAYGDIVDFVE